MSQGAWDSVILYSFGLLVGTCLGIVIGWVIWS